MKNSNSKHLLWFSCLLAMTPLACAAPTDNSIGSWQKMPIRSAQMAARDIGGEGSQWPRGDLAVSPADPNFLLLPIDVGGLYRSLDGGQRWNPAMNGWNARGANAFAIDPKNASRCIGVAGNSMNWEQNWGASPHGIYLSVDKAASWRQVSAHLTGFGGSLAYDPTSFDAAKGYCTRAYYLNSAGDVFRTDDGGQSWAAASAESVSGSIDRDWTLGGTYIAIVRVNSKDGSVWVSGRSGIFRSTDKGQTFNKLRSGATFGLDITPDGTAFASDATGIWKSGDSGANWEKLTGNGLNVMGEFVANVHVSPADPKRLMAWVPGPNWQWKRYVSHDGGVNWTEAKLDTSEALLPTNSRQGYMAWHPTDPNVVWSIGGDWVSKSTDGGKNFKWSNNGYTGVMLGASFNFSPHAPNTVFLGFQDYNGAFTTDGGKSWNYRDISGKGWGGHCYGAGQSDSQTMWYGDAEGWGNPRRLKISHDGGTTWNFANGADGKPLEWRGADISFVDPRNPAILFASNYRSTDKGASWANMDGCDGVYTAAGNVLIGRKGEAIVTSDDAGQTWKNVANVEGGFRDVAFDAQKGRYWVASQDRLKMWDGTNWKNVETPHDQYGNSRIETVALDPQNADVIYCAAARNTYATSASIVRSTDGGATWENLTTGSGPHEVQWIRVHPQTHEAWAAGQCFGMWRIAAPAKLGAADNQKGDSPRALNLPLLLSKSELNRPLFAARNGSMGDEKGGAPDGWTQMWTGRGQLKVVQDKQTFHSEPASLRLEADGADTQGQSGQVIEAPAGSTFTVHGWIKSQGDVKAQAALQPLRDNWSVISFQQLKYVQYDTDWQEFSAEVKLPPETARFQIVLLLEGTGKAWLDDVKLTDVKGP